MSRAISSNNKHATNTLTMSFGVSPNDIVKLANLSRVTYINWKARHGPLNETAVTLRALRDVLENIKSQPLTLTSSSELHVEDLEDWVKLFKKCDSAVKDFATRFDRNSMTRRRVAGSLTISRRSVPDDIKSKLQNAQSRMAMFLFAFGYESMAGVDRVFNDLEMFRRMRESIDEYLPLPVSPCPEISQDDGVAETSTRWWQVVLADKQYTLEQIKNATPALSLYLRRLGSQTPTRIKRADSMVELDGMVEFDGMAEFDGTVEGCEPE